VKLQSPSDQDHTVFRSLPKIKDKSAFRTVIAVARFPNASRAFSFCVGHDCVGYHK